MKISNKEYEEVIHEVADRLRDVVYINADGVIRKYLFKRTLERELDGDFELQVEYGFSLLVNDFRQILARIRRVAEVTEEEANTND